MNNVNMKEHKSIEVADYPDKLADILDHITVGLGAKNAMEVRMNAHEFYQSEIKQGVATQTAYTNTLLFCEKEARLLKIGQNEKLNNQFVLSTPAFVAGLALAWVSIWIKPSITTYIMSGVLIVAYLPLMILVLGRDTMRSLLPCKSAGWIAIIAFAVGIAAMILISTLLMTPMMNR